MDGPVGCLRVRPPATPPLAAFLRAKGAVLPPLVFCTDLQCEPIQKVFRRYKETGRERLAFGERYRDESVRCIIGKMPVLVRGGETFLERLDVMRLDSHPLTGRGIQLKVLVGERRAHWPVLFRVMS